MMFTTYSKKGGTCKVPELDFSITFHPHFAIQSINYPSLGDRSANRFCDICAEYLS